MTPRAVLLDEMYSPDIAAELVERGHDVVAVLSQPALVSVEDVLLLRHAHQEGRCVVTENIRDFAALARANQHAGVLLVPARRWPRSPARVNRLIIALDKVLVEDRLPGPGEIDWLA